MKYKIIEVHQIYNNGKLDELAVLWQSNEKGWVRASYSNSKPCTGYVFLNSEVTISEKLIQDVAGFGMNLPDDKKKIYFPGERKWDH